MMRMVGIALALMVVAGQATAGEILFRNGNHLQAELANEVLMISTGSDVVEVLPDAVAALSPGEVRLTDGRTLRGTLVGGRLKLKTNLGELAVPVEEIAAFHGGAGARAAASAAAPAPAPAAAPASAPSVAAPPAPTRASATAARGSETPSREPPSARPAAPNRVSGTPERGDALEVVTDHTALHRDALGGAAVVGTVARGQQVTYVDYIDRRLTIFNTVVFDGGYWIKVRAPDGTEGWLPATAVRRIQ